MFRYRIKPFVRESDIDIDFSKRLNPEQYAVVMHPGGPMLVLAGAGTGKTTTVTYRVARLIQSGTHPGSILLLTFTNKAAREMMKRAERLVGGDMGGVWGGTFHHLCNMILRRYAGTLRYAQSYTIIDREDSKDMIHNCLAELSYEGVLPKPAVLIEIIGLMKNTETTLERIIESRFPFLIEVGSEIGKIYLAYEDKKRKLNLMDFDDLLLNTRCLLRDHENVRRSFQERFRHILVDEYQDTNHIQAEIVDSLASLRRNITVVGDDAQSIYSFRGADFENIIRFPERYPDAATFKLITNYRSTPEILSLANDTISHNSRQFRKDLHSVHSMGGKPYIVALNDVFEQAQYVASAVTELIAEGELLNDVAILYRSHYQSMELQMEFQKRGIPFEVRSGLKFFEQAHIKDILAYLRLVVNPHDELSWTRSLRLIPGIGNVTARKIFSEISSTDSPLQSIFSTSRKVPKKSMDAFLLFLHALKSIVRDNDPVPPSTAIDIILGNGYEHHLYNTYPDASSREEDISQMSQYAVNYDSIEEFISDLSLQNPTVELINGGRTTEDAVVLSTVHQAKGLEWKHLFVIGLNDGRFPSARALKGEDEEEERRLFYVAVTRAKWGLSLCYTLTGSDTKGLGFLKPSRFIKELNEDLYERVVIERAW
jgi:DNA helicase-2/ATP-dependent DNA helicase PcrA